MIDTLEYRGVTLKKVHTKKECKGCYFLNIDCREFVKANDCNDSIFKKSKKH